MKKWVILNKKITNNKKRITVKDILKILLKNRGLIKKKEIEEFLHPSLDQLSADNLGINKKELNKAVRRIKKAIEDKESIVVYTDYDADGICGGAIIWETLYYLHAKVMPYVPHREKEGYGLSKQGIDWIKKEYKANLIVTVDHGVSAAEKIDYAQSLGIDTIIIDHHLISTKLPKVKALIHTTKLAAGGIAWFFSSYLLAQASLLSKLSTLESASRNLDLAALATIADIVPLLGANRVIVKYGLDQLNKTRRVGLNALINETGLIKGEIGVYEVGYILVPRINAMGRLANALDALRLICTKDSVRATELARILSLTNRERQILSEKTTAHALETVRSNLTVHSDNDQQARKLIFISHKSYKEGIIGLVAGKLVDEFHLPAIVVAKGREYSKASARSINGFNIVGAIRQVSHLLEDVGGHPMAAGFTIATKNLEVFRKRLSKIVEKSIDKEKLEKTIKVDLEINFSDIVLDLYTHIQKLSPFGVGNPQPTFASRNVSIINTSLVGKNKKHLKLLLQQNKAKPDHLSVAKRGIRTNGVFSAIGFGMWEYYGRLFSGMQIDIVYMLDKDDWNGESRLQIKLKDVKVTV